MRIFFIIFLLFFSDFSSAQELYINTEPASLIPKGTKVVRVHHHTIFLNDYRDPLEIKIIIPTINGYILTF